MRREWVVGLIIAALAGFSQTVFAAESLTQEERDSLMHQIAVCWIAPAVPRVPIVGLRVYFNPNGTVLQANIIDTQRYDGDSLFRFTANSLVEALKNPKCSPFRLPADKYDQWKRIDLTFDPKDML
jgi:hypothetical protein